MSYKICFIGDVMLGRMIGSKYAKHPYNVVDDSLVSKAKEADFVIANLESPVIKEVNPSLDHLQFQGNPDVLAKLKWINSFSLANNHINDCGNRGMHDTISILEQYGFQYNGIFKGEYRPLIIENDKIVIITVTDMMNIPFAEQCEWDVLRVGEDRVFDILREYRNNGYFVILYAHIGMLFSRFPNPVCRDYLHKCVDYGANIIVTAHSHCMGCMERYKNAVIFHSLGDFIMDGNSYRRRKSVMLCLGIENRCLADWKIIPAETNNELVASMPYEHTCKKMIKEFDWVSESLAKHSNDYEQFFKWEYKKEMIMHTCSTLSFLYHSKGLIGVTKMVIKRFEEVFRMACWMAKDRSKDKRDDDAIRADRKKFTEKELFD